MLLFLLICVTLCIDSQVLSATLIGWLFWSGSAFFVVPLLTYVSSVDQYLVYLDGKPFVPLLLARYWYLMLQLQLSSVIQYNTISFIAFSIVGPSIWNGLPLEICLLPKNNERVFCRLLKTNVPSNFLESVCA